MPLGMDTVQLGTSVIFLRRPELKDVLELARGKKSRRIDAVTKVANGDGTNLWIVVFK